jgi:hypothetical protein
LPVLNHETQRGPLTWLPLVPEIVHERRRLRQEADEQLRVEAENENQESRNHDREL